MWNSNIVRGNGVLYFKLIAVGMLVFFILSPIAPVFADEPDPPPSQWETDDPEGPPKVPDRIPKKNSLQSTNSTGALTYDVPIVIPPGRNNLQPDIHLTYNSQATEGESIVGQGWSIPIPSISRVNKTGLENLYSENYYTSTLSDELSLISGGGYGAKVDNGEFLTYSTDSNVWTAIDKQGTVYTFGASSASRQDNPSDSSKIFKWMLSEVRDTNDNYITYEYTKDQGQIYPYRITYTGHGSTAGIFQIEFSKELKDDIFTSSQTGFEVNTRYRINEIQAKISGSWVRKYELDYTVSDNGVKSMLESVTESGKSEDTTVTTLPATTFDYQTKPKSWTLNTSWDIPIYFEHNGDQGVRMLDINGDALVDIVQAHKESGGSSVRKVYLNNGTDGWEYDDSWSLPLDFVAGEADTMVRIDDVNGDGLVDLVKSNQSSASNGVYINQGDNDGWVLDTNWDIPVFFQDNTFIDTGARLADANGDGLADIIEARKESSSSTVRKVWINNGSDGWEFDNSWTIPIDFSNVGSDTGVRLADINGDGLIDFIKSNGYSSTANGVYLNSGNKSWVLDSSWSIPLPFYTDDGDNGVRLADANGDGLIDLLQNLRLQNNTIINKLYVNNGAGWDLDTNWSIPTNFSGIYSYDKSVDLGDVNGDGLVDIFQSLQAGAIKKVYIATGEKADLLSTITNSAGAETHITYKGSAEYKDDSGNLLSPNLPLVLQTVQSTDVSDSFGTDITTTYSYAKGKYYFNSQLDRRFSGFGKVTETDDAGNVTTMSFHGGTQSESSLGEYQEHISKMGKPYRIEVKDSSGNLFSKVINKWDKADLGDGRNFVKLVQTVDYTYDGNTSHKDKATAYTYSDTTGNTSTVTNWGLVTGSDDGTFTDTGSDKFTTTLTYASNSSDKGVIGLLSKESVANQSSTMVKETKMYYDTQSWGNATLGNQTKIEDWVQVGDPYVSHQKGYNSYGLVTSETDPRGKVTTYSYDTYNLYPTTSTNPLSQATTSTYDYSSGAVKQTTDPNGSVYTTVFDGLDRPLEEKIPDVNGSGQVTKATYEYTDTTNALKTKKRTYLDSSNIVDTYTYFDGLRRKIQERNEAATSSQFSVRDSVYSHDKLLKESLPYFSSNSARTTATTDTDLYTSYTYDTLDRIKTAVTAVGTTTTDYNDWKTTVTDPDSKVKDLYRDAYDNLIQVDEHTGSSTYTTTYEYNVLHKLTKLTDAAGNIRNFTYNGISNLLTSQDLHATADTTFGTWNYSYDAASNLTSRTDPNGHVVNFSYDDINRVLTENYTGTSGTEVTFEYDTCSNGIGHLCEIENTASTTNYNYNKLGQRSTEAMTIGSEDFSTSYTYDRQGNQLMINNPDWSQIQYLYDAGGLVNKIKHKEDSDANFSDVISSITYNPVGLIDTIEYHNGSSTTNTYDAEELYRLRHKVTTAGDDDIQNLTYTYDSVGNIEQIVDASETDTAKTTDYSYDDLHRLTTSEISEAENPGLDGPNEEQTIQDFTYDSIGNIESSPEAGEYSYLGSSGSSYANPHAVTETDGGYTLTYDHNGNITSTELDEDTTTYAWDYNNRLVDIEKNEDSFLYTYDTTGQRIKAETPSNTFYYPTKYFTSADDGIEKHIFLGDTAVASVKGSNYTAEVFTIHADHLTGSNILTDENEDISQILDYYSFGTLRLDDQIGSYSEKRKFTGHEFDEGTGLTYMEARYYDAKLGRFLSQDSAVLSVGFNLSNPQSANYYSYTLNNPLRYKDPNGKDAKDYINSAGGYGVGFLQGSVNTILALGNAVIHPIQTVNNAGNFFSAGINSGQQLAMDLYSYPNQTINEIRAGIGISINEFESKSPYEQGKVIGNLVGQVEVNVAASYGVSRIANAVKEEAAVPNITAPYKRPSNATTLEQRASVQGKSCATCGQKAPTMVADHKVPLVQEYYNTGTIDVYSMRRVESVQPQCPTCSVRQGGFLSNFSKQMKNFLGFNNN